MGTAPETFLYGAMQMIAGVIGSSFTRFLSCGNLLSEADDPMVVSDVEAGMWLSAAAARLPFFSCPIVSCNGNGVPVNESNKTEMEKARLRAWPSNEDGRKPSGTTSISAKGRRNLCNNSAK